MLGLSIILVGLASVGSVPGPGGEPKISVVTALLPPRGGHAVAGARFRIEAWGGCFRWTSQRPDLVVIEEPLAEEFAPATQARQSEAACQGTCSSPEGSEPLQDLRCQSVAFVRSLAQDVEGVEKVLVLAQDQSSPGLELRCEIYLTRIERIEVETSVRRISVDDVETLAVKAYDKQGNVFSSLEGLQFDWRISNPAVLRRPALVDSAMKLSPTRRALAEQGAQPDMVLLQGLATGRATVGATLLSTVGRTISSTDVPLTVSENLVALPSVVRLPPVGHIQLRLKVLRGAGRPLKELPDVHLPAAHLRWHAEPLEGGKDVLHVDPALGQAVAQRLGTSRAICEDARIENNSATALIYVVQPAELRVWPLLLAHDQGTGSSLTEASPASRPGAWLGGLEGGWDDVEKTLVEADSQAALHSPQQNLLSRNSGPWQFVQGQIYALRLELLDSSAQVMRIPSNFRVSALCETEETTACPLQMVRQSPSSAVIIFRALKLGGGHIAYEKASVEADKEDVARNLQTLNLPRLQKRQAFQVVEPLRPLAPFDGPMVLPLWHIYRLRTAGGSGNQTFALRRLDPPGVATVSRDGRVEVFGQTGSADLVVSDARNPDNNFTLRVLVRDAGALVLQPKYTQMELSSPGSKTTKLPVRVMARPEGLHGDSSDEEFSYRGLFFWNCSALLGPGKVKADSSDDSVAVASLVANSGEYTGDVACSIILVRPLSNGSFLLLAEAPKTNAPGSLVASVPLQVFQPLHVKPPALPREPRHHGIICGEAADADAGEGLANEPSEPTAKTGFCDDSAVAEAVWLAAKTPEEAASKAFHAAVGVGMCNESSASLAAAAAGRTAYRIALSAGKTANDAAVDAGKVAFRVVTDIGFLPKQAAVATVAAVANAVGYASLLAGDARKESPEDAGIAAATAAKAHGMDADGIQEAVTKASYKAALIMCKSPLEAAKVAAAMAGKIASQDAESSKEEAAEESGKAAYHAAIVTGMTPKEAAATAAIAASMSTADAAISAGMPFHQAAVEAGKAAHKASIAAGLDSDNAPKVAAASAGKAIFHYASMSNKSGGQAVETAASSAYAVARALGLTEAVASTIAAEVAGGAASTVALRAGTGFNQAENAIETATAKAAEAAGAAPQTAVALATFASSASRADFIVSPTVETLVIAPCSSAKISFSGGPLRIAERDRELHNLTAATFPEYVRIRRLHTGPGDEADGVMFEVLCLQATPGLVHLVAKVIQEPADRSGLHGRPVIGMASLRLRCAAPARIVMLPESPKDRVGPRPYLPDRLLGLRRGHAQRFQAHFLDSEGMRIFNASGYQVRWLISGAADAKNLLNVNPEKETLADVLVPEHTDAGLNASLQVEALPPSNSVCISANALGVREAALVHNSVSTLRAPKGDSLTLAIREDVAVHLPGTAGKNGQYRYPMDSRAAFVIETSGGTGRPHLSLLSNAGESGVPVLEIVENPRICSGQTLGKDCLLAVAAGHPGAPLVQAEPGVRRWFLRPRVPGTAKVAITDPDLLGAKAECRELTFQSGQRLTVGVLDNETSADRELVSTSADEVLVVQGSTHPLRIGAFDIESQPLGPATWPALGLWPRSSAPGLEVRKDPKRPGEYEFMCSQPGKYAIWAEMRPAAREPVNSNSLRVHCFPELALGSRMYSNVYGDQVGDPTWARDIVVMPGQVFELVLTGGPGNDNTRWRLEYASGDPRLAEVEKTTGLVVAHRPGLTELTVRLLELGTQRELARAKASIRVLTPESASIEALSSWGGLASSESPAPMLQRGALEPLRLRVSLRGRDGIELSPLMVATSASGLLPALANSSHWGKGCVFHWKSTESAAVLTPIGTASWAADVFVPDEGTPPGTEVESVELAVQGECPTEVPGGVLRLTARRKLPVHSALRLIAPAAPAVSCEMGASMSPQLIMPPLGRVPLSFSVPQNLLKLQLLGVSRPRLLEVLNGSNSSMELRTGPYLGSAAIQAEETQEFANELGQGTSRNLLLSVHVRMPLQARIQNVPQRLPLNATALCPILLADANGQSMVLPSNFKVSHASSDPSVLLAQIVPAPDGTRALQLMALKEGCSLVSVTIVRGDERTLGSDLAQICVVRGSLLGHPRRLLLQPGARLHLSAEELTGGADCQDGSSRTGRRPLTFSLRLLELPAGAKSPEGAGAKLAKDVSSILSAKSSSGKPIAVRSVDAHWSTLTDKHQRSQSPVPGIEVDLEASAGELADAMGRRNELGLRDLADLIWIPAGEEFDQHDRNVDAKLDVHEMVRRSEAQAQAKDDHHRLDVNKDGYVDMTEFTSADSGHEALDKYDKNEDARLNIQEMEARGVDVMDRRRQELAVQTAKDELKRLDANEDGYVDEAEFMSGGGSDDVFQSYDQNGDKTLDASEMRALGADVARRQEDEDAVQAGKSELRRMDANRDGVVDRMEFVAGGSSTSSKDGTLGNAFKLLDTDFGVRGPISGAAAGRRPCTSRCRGCCGSSLLGSAARLCQAESWSAEGWSSSRPDLLEVASVQRLGSDEVVAIARAQGFATLRFCDGAVRSEVAVEVAEVDAVVVESMPEGGPSSALAASKLVSNEISSKESSAIVVPLKLQRGAWQQDEFRSGPFLSQNVGLRCEAADPAVNDFFDFADADLGELSSGRLRPFGCNLRPRPTQAALWASRLAPRELVLRASVGRGQGTSVRWPFVPQFGVLDASGKQVSPGGVCATLSASRPTSVVVVWTGGHPLEVSLTSQISNLVHGNVSIKVSLDTTSDWETHPSASITLTWLGAVPWGVSESIGLRLASPLTGQVEHLQVRAEPSAVCAPPASPSGLSWLQRMLLSLAVLGLLWLAWTSLTLLNPAPTAAAPLRSTWRGPDVASPFRPVGF